MDWRAPVDKDEPTAKQRPADLVGISSAEDLLLRRAARDPEELERAVRARAYTERLKSEGHRL